MLSFYTYMERFIKAAKVANDPDPRQQAVIVHEYQSLLTTLKCLDHKDEYSEPVTEVLNHRRLAASNFHGEKFGKYIELLEKRFKKWKDHYQVSIENQRLRQLLELSLFHVEQSSHKSGRLVDDIHKVLNRDGAPAIEELCLYQKLYKLSWRALVNERSGNPDRKVLRSLKKLRDSAKSSIFEDRKSNKPVVEVSEVQQ